MWKFAYIDGDQEKLEHVRKLMTTFKTYPAMRRHCLKWAIARDAKMNIDLGPCASCGTPMKPSAPGWALCPKCGYEAKHKRPTAWCTCEEQKAEQNEEHIVWEDGGHG
jgi:predicted amidophosphoribosyltransferase